MDTEKKPVGRPAKSQTEEFTEKPMQDSSILAIASAIGEAIAKNIGSVQKNDPKGAASVATQIQKKVDRMMTRQSDFADKISREMKDRSNLVAVNVPTIYRKYKPLWVLMINGCTVTIPSDGKTRYIHKRYARKLKQGLAYLDKKISAMEAQDNIREMSSTAI